MPIISTGVFIILVAMGFGSLIASPLLRIGVFFAVIGAVAFFSISLLMFANYDVISTTTYVDSSSQWNETNYMVGAEGDSDDEIQQKIWVGWIFFVLGIVAVAVFFLELLKLGKAT